MKRNRLIFLALWLSSLIFISFRGGALSYGIFAALTAVPFVSLAYAAYVYWAYRIRQECFTPDLVAGRPTPFYFTLVNEFPLGFCSIRVGFFSSFSTITGLSDDTDYELLPGSRVKKETSLLCRYRGDYEIGIKSVEICDYFRLIRLQTRNRETLMVHVRPALRDLGEEMASVLEQSVVRDSLINPSEPDVLVRDYETGDDIRGVSWKATARTGKLLVRKKTGQRQEGAYILMGTERFSTDQREYLPLENKMLELTLSLALYFVKRNSAVHVAYLGSGYREASAASMAGFDPFYEEMAALCFDSALKESELLSQCLKAGMLYECGTCVMVLHEWGGEARRTAGLLRQNGVSVLACIINSGEVPPSESQALPGIRLMRLDPEEDGKEAGR